MTQKIGNVAHRALTLQELTVAYSENTDRIICVFIKVLPIMEGSTAIVLKEHKEKNNEQDFWLGDPTYRIFENIKSPRGICKSIRGI